MIDNELLFDRSMQLLISWKIIKENTTEESYLDLRRKYFQAWQKFQNKNQEEVI